MEVLLTCSRLDQQVNSPALGEEAGGSGDRGSTYFPPSPGVRARGEGGSSGDYAAQDAPLSTNLLPDDVIAPLITEDDSADVVCHWMSDYNCLF